MKEGRLLLYLLIFPLFHYGNLFPCSYIFLPLGVIAFRFSFPYVSSAFFFMTCILSFFTSVPSIIFSLCMYVFSYSNISAGLLLFLLLQISQHLSLSSFLNFSLTHSLHPSILLNLTFSSLHSPFSQSIHLSTPHSLFLPPSCIYLFILPSLVKMTDVPVDSLPPSMAARGQLLHVNKHPLPRPKHVPSITST